MLNGIKNWFWRSETIFWARLQYIGGLLAAGLIAAFSQYDFSQLATMDLMVAFKMLLAAAVSGIITEWLRRRRSIPETVVVPERASDGSVEEVPKSFLATPPPGP
jgi:hypothetical protein